MKCGKTRFKRIVAFILTLALVTEAIGTMLLRTRLIQPKRMF